MSGYPNIDQGPFRRTLLYGPDGNPIAKNSLGALKAQQQEITGIEANGAAGAAVTLTIPAPGAGIFNFLAWLHIICYATAARAGGAAPTVVTSTQIGGLRWTFPTAMAIGTQVEAKYEGMAPIRAGAAASAITIVCPATTSVIWEVLAGYFQAS